MEHLTAETACVPVQRPEPDFSDYFGDSDAFSTGQTTPIEESIFFPEHLVQKSQALRHPSTRSIHSTSVLQPQTPSKKFNRDPRNFYRNSTHESYPLKKNGKVRLSPRNRSRRKAAISANCRATKLQRFITQSIENGELVNAMEVVAMED